MPYDDRLSDRVRDVLEGEPGLTEKRMFGGLAFLLEGHMAVAASGQGGLLVRIDPADSESLVDGREVTRMEMRGRELSGWLRVAEAAVSTDDELRGWVDRAVGYVRELPPK